MSYLYPSYSATPRSAPMRRPSALLADWTRSAASCRPAATALGDHLSAWRPFVQRIGWRENWNRKAPYSWWEYLWFPVKRLSLKTIDWWMDFRGRKWKPVGNPQKALGKEQRSSFIRTYQNQETEKMGLKTADLKHNKTLDSKHGDLMWCLVGKGRPLLQRGKSVTSTWEGEIQTGDFGQHN